MPDAQSAITVRPAHGPDIRPLAELIAPFVEQRKLLPRTVDELALLLPNYFVAEAPGDDGQGRLIGCAALEIYSSKLAELRSLVVIPEYQGHGVGKLLVEACVNRARDEQILEVMAITSSEEFFQSCGFDFTLPGEKKALFLQTREA
ncbi:MAG TPA: GNAT family N-acetyltransferase [Planctomycetaceae bacterium]|jgi:N-acetylglutamate synthase-like GNAT family acetyltransferase